MADTKALEGLLEFCNDGQRQKIEAVIKHGGNVTQASKELGYKDEASIRHTIKRVKHTAAKMGYAPEANLNHKVPQGFSIKRISTFTNKDGDVGEWVIKEVKDEERYSSMLNAWSDFCKDIKPVQLTPIPTNTMYDLLCDYTIGDAHIGLYAWAEEAGDDFDLDTATDMLHKATNHLVNSSPPAHTAFILDVGDYFHADDQSNETRKSKNKLDVDTRWAKVLEAGIKCACSLIDLALQKHQKVLWRSVIGNHNIHSATMINLAMKMRYANEPRVEILDKPSTHHYYQFGKNLLADTHGDTQKPDALPLIMASDVPTMWGETTNRVWRTGHVHHASTKDYTGATVITYRTLAPKDAWHASSGYRSNRDMRCTIYHKDNGMVGMSVVNPSMIGY